MSGVSWIKLKIDMFSDEKIRLIETFPEADGILIIWIKLLCLAGKTNANGCIYLSENIPFTSTMLSTILNRPQPVIELALGVLSKFGMISINNDGIISIEQWAKHQNVEGLDRVREQTRRRVQKHRETKKIPLLENKNEEERIDIEGNVTETLHEKIQELWIRTFGRNPLLPEIEQSQKLIDNHGKDKVYKLFKDAVLSGVKNMRTLIERTDPDGNFIPYQKTNNQGVEATTPLADKYL